ILAGSLVSSVQGQVVIQPIGILQNPLVLVGNKDVQKDLPLSEEQIKKIAELTQKQTDALKGVGFQETEKRKQIFEASQKGLNEVLTAEQVKRLKQLELQQRGPNAFLEASVIKDLNIANEQRTAVLQILKGFGPKWVAIIQGAKGNQQQIQA